MIRPQVLYIIIREVNVTKIVNNMQTHITPNNKLASFGTIGLLFLAGVTGMVFLLPLNSAHAASPTVTLSTITSGVETAATSGTVGSSLTITGSGFASSKPIAISTTVGSTTVSLFTTPSTCAGAFTTAIGGNTGTDSLLSGGCLTSSAAGNFKVTVAVPAMPGGAQTIVTTDGTSSVSTAFAITPAVTFKVAAPNVNFGFPEQTLSGVTIAATGFGSAESVTLTSTAFTTASLPAACNTGATVGGSATTGAGSCQFLVGGSITIAETTSGAKTITATGATSALSASTTYTVKPWAAFYNSAAGGTAFSFVGTAPTSVLVEAHGLAAGTIASNSITINGVATSHASVVVGSTGAFGGVGGQLVVAPSATVPFGPSTVVIGGVSFNYATGNIASGVGTWGGVLITSIQGTTAGTGVVITDASSYKPGAQTTPSYTNPGPAQNQIGFFGYGFIPSAGTLAIAQPTQGTYLFTTSTLGVAGVTYKTASAGTHVDGAGALFAIAYLSDSPWSVTATPSTATTYSTIVTQPVAGVNGPSNVLSPSYGITPWIDTSKSAIGATTVDYTTTTETFKAHGFGATDTLTTTIGTVAMVSGGTCTGGNAPVQGGCTTLAGQVPDLAAGAQNVVVTGSVTAQSVTATGAVTYDPIVNFAGYPAVGGAGPAALNVVQGGTGSTTILRTGTTFGAHGLTANTAYSVVWNGAGGTVVGTFTSTASGGIPVPGVQITVPADISGIHIVDIQPTASIGTSAIFGNTNVVGDMSLSDAIDVGGLGATYASNYGDLLFNSLTSLVATPTVANIGNVITVSGNGLGSSTLYDLGVSQAGGGTAILSSTNPPNSCSFGSAFPPSFPNQILGQFTSTSGGGVPAGAGLTLTDTPTYPGNEQGTLFCAFAYTAANFGTATATGIAQFELQASGSLNMTTAPAGHNVVMTAHALAANTAYNIVFNYAVNSAGTTYTGTVVGAVLTSASGAGTSTFTVPGVATGSNTVELVRVGATGLTGVALANAPTFTVGQSVTQGCQTTSCLTIGSPSQVTIGGTKSVSYTHLTLPTICSV